MTTPRLACFGLLACLVLQPALVANAGIFYGAGHTVRLDKTEAIQLVTEDVTIVPGRGRFLFSGGQGDWVDYSCRFTLKNLKNEPVEVQVGFPLTSQSFDRGGPVSASEAELVEHYRFIARDEDRTYHVRFVARDEEERFHHLFLWTMQFAPGETRELRVSYGMSINFGLMPLTRKYGVPREFEWMRGFEHSVLESFGYVTETGASWAGPIEKATFRLYTAGFEAYLAERPTFESTPEDIAAKEERRVPTLWYRQLALEGGQPFIHERSPDRTLGLEWVFAPFEPGPSIGATYYLTVFPRRPDDMRRLCRLLVEHEHADLSLVREILAAFFGLAPSSPAVVEFVANQIWYEPVEGRTEASLPDEQRALLAAVDDVITEAQSPPK